MRITSTLARVASLLVATGYGIACGTDSDNSTQDAGGDDASVVDAGPRDTGPQNPCFVDSGPPPTVTITADQACDLLANEINAGDINAEGPICHGYCGDAGFLCGMPIAYSDEFVALNVDAGTFDEGNDAGDGGTLAMCPPDAGSITVQCYSMDCTGRLTEGHRAPETRVASSAHRFAAMAFLEAVSVHAFARLERELRAHGADANLVRGARRAAHEERRHTTIMSALARRGGVVPEMPCTSNGAEIRSLFEVALENAVEGCVRETYGAVMGLVEARRAADETTRRALGAVAVDECRHAELAWAVHAWATSRLSSAERERIRDRMLLAIDEIAARDPRTAELLFERSDLKMAAAA